MKKITVLALMIILSLLIVSGCSNDIANDIEENETTTQEENIDNDEVNDEEITEEQGKAQEETLGDNETVKEGADVGERAYDFTLTDREGNEVSLSDYQGKVVFLNFWASWCPPCVAEMPYIQNNYVKFMDSDDVAVLTVNITKAEENGVDDTNEFMEENGYNFPVLLDTEGEVSDKYRVRSIPTTYIINKEGIVYNYVVGPLSEDRMLEQINGAIRQSDDN